jgi:hypothetical protein
MAEDEVDQFETALANMVSKDIFKFDSFLIYILGFFFGFLFAIGIVFFFGGWSLLSDSLSFTNWSVFLCGIGLGALGVVGGVMVWMRQWIGLLACAGSCCGAYVVLYIVLVYSYIVSHEVRSAMTEFADSNWRLGSSIATTELNPNYCIETVPVSCFAPLVATAGQAIQPEDACDVACKAAWVKDADDGLKPLGYCVYFTAFVVLCTIVINNQVLEDDGFEKMPKQIAAYVSGRNRCGGSGGSLEPPGPLLAHLHTVYMAYSECLPA